MGRVPLLTPLLLKKKPQSRRKTQTIFKSPLTRYVQVKGSNKCADCSDCDVSGQYRHDDRECHNRRATTLFSSQTLSAFPSSLT